MFKAPPNDNSSKIDSEKIVNKETEVTKRKSLFSFNLNKAGEQNFSSLVYSETPIFEIEDPEALVLHIK